MRMLYSCFFYILDFAFVNHLKIIVEDDYIVRELNFAFQCTEVSVGPICLCGGHLCSCVFVLMCGDDDNDDDDGLLFAFVSMSTISFLWLMT